MTVDPDRPESRPSWELPPRPLPPDAGTEAEPWFDEAMLRPPGRPPPAGGPRRLLWRASGGRLNLGPTADDLRRQSLVRRAQHPVRGTRIVAVVSAKGGVGKTTTALLTGVTYAMHRGDRCVALDANHDAGSLVFRLPRRDTLRTVADLLRDAPAIVSYSQLASYVTISPTRLAVLASSMDPRVSQGLGEAEYRVVLDLLERYFSVILCDLGTGLLDPGTTGLLGQADQVIVVTGASLDEGRVASFTLDWLSTRWPRKVAEGVVVVNGVGHRNDVDVDAVVRYFRRRVRSVVRVPWDAHIANGGAPDWELLRSETQDAFLETAAEVADGFVPAAAG